LVAGALWFGVVVVTKRQIFYLAIAVGAIIGTAVAKGTRRPSLRDGAVAGAITLVTMAVSQYFIDRWFVIKALQEARSTVRFPLLLSIPRSIDLVHAGISEDPVQLLFWGLAVLLAFITVRKHVA
jgi:hypothetical protein